MRPEEPSDEEMQRRARAEVAASYARREERLRPGREYRARRAKFAEVGEIVARVLASGRWPIGLDDMIAIETAARSLGLLDEVKPLRTLKCDMIEGCIADVTHIDDKGYLYCAEHGPQRREGGRRCRKLTPSELDRLRRDEAIRYDGAKP